MLTCRRIVNLAVARQLVGLLPVLPAALSVPLPCQAAVLAVRLAHQSQRQRDIDKRQRIVDALSLLAQLPAPSALSPSAPGPALRAACMRFGSDTPVIRSTRSGQYVETVARTEANPSVCALDINRVYQTVPHQNVHDAVGKLRASVPGVSRKCRSAL